jgi:hypothetical protein
MAFTPRPHHPARAPPRKTPYGWSPAGRGGIAGPGAAGTGRRSPETVCTPTIPRRFRPPGRDPNFSRRPHRAPPHPTRTGPALSQGLMPRGHHHPRRRGHHRAHPHLHSHPVGPLIPAGQRMTHRLATHRGREQRRRLDRLVGEMLVFQIGRPGSAISSPGISPGSSRSGQSSLRYHRGVSKVGAAAG